MQYEILNKKAYRKYGICKRLSSALATLRDNCLTTLGGSKR